MHLASVLGTPIIAFTGVVSPGTLQSFGKKDQVIYKKNQCSRCFKRTRKPEYYEGDAECERVIEVEDVFKVMERLRL